MQDMGKIQLGAYCQSADDDWRVSGTGGPELNLPVPGHAESLANVDHLLCGLMICRSFKKTTVNGTHYQGVGRWASIGVPSSDGAWYVVGNGNTD